MLLKFEFNPNIPIYLQIIAEIKRQIVSGEMDPGGKVDSVRDLAKNMGVNPNTMQRAFAELERLKLIYTERTSGRFITKDSQLIEKIKAESVRGQVSDFVEIMSKSGFHKLDILRLVKEFMEESENE
ncbi:GntR family transcriptional regulator [Clostridium estertheticum]|uniref:GntR family transcriptional regulator n=1 Tax=Clostridium estertheticum TaxID=238834 RepID=UPI001CF24996|nr:GntR family transcriptional regulator [Clostridium estertheticum]MCB2338692.1 GntR family transcriptional regulator [Clostridium estertheticum]